MWDKIETVGTIGQFLKNDSNVGSAVILQPVLDWIAHPVEHMKQLGGETIYNYTSPVFDILSVLAYPVANIIICVAGLLYILNMKERAITWITKTSIIYILIQLLPLLTRTVITLLAI
ncbi:hypothetical protein [Priestia koreensis]|uniref:hypothetical protein n=1 Tax=Priestia koreensis TaxID=284581 RepID=UPI0006A991A7|nr:hypothetical protein [Priestia koreensis]